MSTSNAVTSVHGARKPRPSATVAPVTTTAIPSLPRSGEPAHEAPGFGRSHTRFPVVASTPTILLTEAFAYTLSVSQDPWDGQVFCPLGSSGCRALVLKKALGSAGAFSLGFGYSTFVPPLPGLPAVLPFEPPDEEAYQTPPPTISAIAATTETTIAVRRRPERGPPAPGGCGCGCG